MHIAPSRKGSSAPQSEAELEFARSGCDLVKLKIGDLVSGGSLRERATVIQQKTGRPVQFEIMSEARKSLEAWL